MPSNNLELMSPVGSFEALAAALRAGADSVYFGAGKLNMRSRSSVNFSLADLHRIVRRCRRAGVKTYLTLNTVVYDSEIDEIQRLCRAAAEAGVDAVIAADPSVIRFAHDIGIPVHISVQANVANLEAVRFFAPYADVMVLARELTLEQIAAIINGIKKENITGPSGQLVRIELFAHGALCVSVSGKCYMSLALYNASANRGACVQNCRRSYRVIDEESGQELQIERHHIMSPKDICTINVIDRLAEAGVSVFKLEGRGRSPDYVYKVTRAYKEALTACASGQYTPDRVEHWMKELSSVFNRGFWMGGYYLGEPQGEWTDNGGNCATKVKHHIGKVTRYFSKPQVAEIELEAGDLEVGNEIFISGCTTGAAFITVTEIRVDGIPCQHAAKGALISIPAPEKLRANDKVYLLKTRRFGENTPRINSD